MIENAQTKNLLGIYETWKLKPQKGEKMKRKVTNNAETERMERALTDWTMSQRTILWAQ
jgi:hypothetical protein